MIYFFTLGTNRLSKIPQPATEKSKFHSWTCGLKFIIYGLLIWKDKYGIYNDKLTTGYKLIMQIDKQCGHPCGNFKWKGKCKISFWLKLTPFDDLTKSKPFTMYTSVPFLLNIEMMSTCLEFTFLWGEFMRNNYMLLTNHVHL